MKQYIILLILLVSGALTAAPAFAQKSGTKHTVTGKVTDQSGEPLIGATVLVTGTTNGASTNATGDYSIQVPEGASLTFQYIGYEAKTEKVGARTKVDVKLEQSKQTIDEVVVIGYGTVKKTDLTGQPIGQFMKNYRLNVAQRMIQEGSGDVNVSEIAYAVGFNDPKYFTKCFKEFFGYLPSSKLGKKG